MVPGEVNANQPRTIDLSNTIRKMADKSNQTTRVVSHLPRIATPPKCVSSHPFGLPINQKGWGTNVGPNSGPYAKRAGASLGHATLSN